MSERNDEHDSKGFRKLGNLIPQAARSPKIVDGPPTGSSEKSNGSGSITGPAVAGSPTSVQPGRSGLPTRATLSLVEALATRDPDKVDRSLLYSLPSSVKASLREHLAEGSYLGPYGFDPVTESFELEQPVDAAELMAARALLAEALKPADRQLIAEELVKLRLRTKARDIADAQLSAQLNLYADDLAEYPADVVVDAMRAWGRRETFWPSAAEIITECDRRVLRRQRLRAALSRERASE